MILRFVCLLVLLTGFQALAHAPYERPGGTFKRSDGAEVLIVRRYMDGIITRDPMAIALRLTNHTLLSKTETVPDAIIRKTANGINVYLYRSTILPLGATVEFHDGYGAMNIRPAGWIESVSIHIAAHWLGYTVVIACSAIYYGIFRITHRKKPGPLLTILSGGCAVFFFLLCYDALFFEALSPVLLAFLFLLAYLIRRWFHRSRVANPG